MCHQQRLRPACVYTQSDQSLCLSLEYSMALRPLTQHHLEFLSSKGGCTGSSDSTHVIMPHCWRSHVAAHMGLQARKPCEQQRRRPACPSTQSDQRLCYPLIGKYHTAKFPFSK